MKTKRLHRDDSESHIVLMLYQHAKKQPHDGAWRSFDEIVEHKGRRYQIKAEYVLLDSSLQYKNLEVKGLDRERLILN